MAEQCRCTHIAVMQLFHELKQAFPTVPDEVVSQCIRQNAQDKAACERVLRREVQAHMVHSYPYPPALMTGMAAAPGPGGPGPGKRPTAPLPVPVPVCPQRPAVSPRPSRSAALPPRASGDPSSRSPVLPQRPDDLRARVRDLNLHIPPAAPSSACTSPTASRAGASAGTTPRTAGVVAGDPMVNGPLRCPADSLSALDVDRCDSPQPQPPPRVTATLHVQPAPHYHNPVVPPRSYTSVNLTLRPPSSEPQPPIDIHSAGSSLTYSTSSYDPRQGYQSQLQIRIGPGGLGSVSAQRTRAPVPPSPPVPPPPTPPRPQVHSVPLVPVPPIPEEESKEDAVMDVRSRLSAMGGEKLAPETREHLVRQLERRALLEAELRRESEKLRAMQREVSEMERDLQRRTTSALSRPRVPPALPVIQKVQRLRTEIQQLQNECTRMASEVDSKTPVTLPLGETDEEFYKNIYTGPSGSLWPHIPQSTPRRPEESSGESGWTCQVCTFHNHYLLEACETCDMPRIRIGRAATQDIHIRVTHHNFPTRRSLHGWVD